MIKVREFFSRTSFHGATFEASYNDLVKVFGEPQINDNLSEDKINFVWNLTINDIDCDIYDWKYYTIIDKNEVIEWNIATYDGYSSNLIKQFIIDKLGML